jgi:hypothetical protein
MWGAQHRKACDFTAIQQLTDDKSRLNSFANAYVVCYQ